MMALFRAVRHAWGMERLLGYTGASIYIKPTSFVLSDAQEFA